LASEHVNEMQPDHHRFRSTTASGTLLTLRAMTKSAAVLVAAVALLSSPVARAQSEADIATAREIAKEAFSAYDAGDFPRAEQLFERASKLYQAPTLLLGLARARAKLGKYVEARENYLRIIRAKLPDDANDAFREAQETARREVQEVEPKIAWVTVSLDGAEASEITITIDDHAVPPEAIGARRPVDPGRHVVRANGDGFESFAASFEVGEGGAETIAVRVVRSSPDSIDPPPVVPPEHDESSAAGGSVLPIVGWSLLGVGGAGLIVGAVTGGVAVSQHGELSDNCVGNRCEADQYGTLDSFETMSTVSTVGLVAGGVIAAVGLTLVLVAPSEGDASATLRLGPGSLSFSTTF
jgi:hypothetical protein